MARRHDYVPPELDTRYGSSDNYDTEASMGQDWLSMNDPSLQTERAINGDVEGEDLNGISPAGLMEHRVKSMGLGVQAATKAIYGGQLGTLESKIAAENYHNVTGENPQDAARRIKLQEISPVTITDSTGKSRTQSGLAYSDADMRIAQGMLGDDNIAKYMNRGVGSAQEGNTYGVEAHEKDYRDSLANAYATIRSIAPMVIDPLVPQGAGYESRLLQAEEGLIKFGMEAVGGGMNSEGIYAGGGNRNRMPNPNEIPVRGRRSTWGQGTGKQGTPFTQLEYDAATSPGGSLHGNPEATRYIPSGYKSYGVEKEEFNGIQKRYVDAMKVIRASTLTQTDEVYGNSERSSGTQKPREDWDARSNVYDAAAIQDMDMYQPDFIAGPAPKQGKGSMAGGMYGEKGLSERDIFAEDYAPESDIDPLSDRGQYVEQMRNAPEQGSAEWLTQRKSVDFTASTIGILGSGSGTDKMATNLRLRKKDAKGVTEGYNYKGEYSKNTAFVGNTYTREGNQFEKDVRGFFMAQVGTPAGLEYQEAFFERGEGDLSNFGVTPDARLYDKQGKSAGLAEFKLKRGKAFNTVLDDYYDQVQLQMAVTGETQTHLFALDQHTDKTSHNLVLADPKRQEFLIDQANAAKLQSEGMTLKDTQELMKVVKARKAAANKAIPKVAGEEARLESLGTTEGQDEATAFVPYRDRKESFQDKMANTAAAAMSDKVKGDVSDINEINEIPPNIIAAKAQKKVEDQRIRTAVDLETYKYKTPNEVHGEANKENDAVDREAEARAVKGLADAASTTTGQLLIMSAGLSKVGDVLGAVADKFLGESSVDESRIAASTGQDVEEVRGQRMVLESANVSTGAINHTLNRSGDIQSQLKSEVGAGKFYSDVNTKMLMASRTIPELKGYQTINPSDRIGTSGQAMLSEVMEFARGKSPAAQKYIYEAYGYNPELGIADKVTGENIGEASFFMDEEGTLEQNKGIMKSRQLLRQYDEATESIGYEVGVTAGAGKRISEMLSVKGMTASAIQAVANGLAYQAEGNVEGLSPWAMTHGTTSTDTNRPYDRLGKAISNDRSWMFGADEPEGHKSAIPSQSYRAPRMLRNDKEIKVDLQVDNHINVDNKGNYDTSTEINGEVDKQFGTGTGGG